MSEGFLGSCKAALNNLIASEPVAEHTNPYSAFSDGLRNFFSHYCLDDHSSEW